MTVVCYNLGFDHGTPNNKVTRSLITVPLVHTIQYTAVHNPNRRAHLNVMDLGYIVAPISPNNRAVILEPDYYLITLIL